MARKVKIFDLGFYKLLLFFAILPLMGLLILTPSPSSARVINYQDAWSNAGFNLLSQDVSGVELIFSIREMAINDIVVDGQTMQVVNLPGVFLPNDAGMPNLPGTGRFIAIPQGSSAKFTLIDYRTEVIKGLDLAPAPPIPKETDNSPLIYKKNPEVYNRNANYPDNPVRLSEVTDIRGVDVVVLGITPFQYNPVTKDLIVYRDLRVRVDFIGGNGHFGEDRLRNRYFEPILQGNILNYGSLPAVNFNHIHNCDEDNVEYIIIIPDDPAFEMWADSVKVWRNQQGIITGITHLSEIGGNNATAIENYINNAYNTWTIPPVAVLLLSDYQNSGDLYGITSPVWNSYCVSDNIYADVNGNNLPDIILARITAQDAADLSMMVEKFLSYERTPPTDPNYYYQPLIAAGWQSDRWFVLCAEVVYGFMENVLDKRPVRQYAGASGPPSQWSTNPNTYMIVDYFGPTGLGYIPTTPSYLTNWSGNATGINNAINNGAFFTLHRDHGSETGWGTPSYTIPNLSGLNNDELTFVFSINCLTGKYNWSSECFCEAFHRMEHGALGIIGASEVSYSFVNDTYCWGMFDSMWPEFDPFQQFPPATEPQPLRPAFANAYGKYYLAASSWPYNQGDKTVTYHLFHHHGDAFITLYSEVPQNLTVSHPPVLLGGANSFTVTANVGSLIALTVNNQIIGVAEGTGAPVNITIPPQTPGTTMLVTVTLQNYYRYMQEVSVIPPSGPYVIAGQCVVADSFYWCWNPNGQLDYGEQAGLTLTMTNIGIEATPATTLVTISCDDTLLTINDGWEYYGIIPANNSVTVNAGFTVTCDEAVEDGHIFTIDVVANSGGYFWESSFALMAHAPDVVYDRLTIDDPLGNNNNWLDPGETADLIVYVTNDGSSIVNNLTGTISTSDPYVTINTANGTFGSVPPGGNPSATFTVTADPTTPMEHVAIINLLVQGDLSYQNELEFEVMIGNIMNEPTGPDNYGYSAYDPFDLPELPVYQWVEISADSGGPGTMVPFINDDEVFQYALPFDFQYYGIDYDSISIATNGWVAMGIVTVEDYSNSSIPNTDGPERMIAAYWEDLSPQRPNSGKVWRWYDSANHRYLVEYNHIEQYTPAGNFETFEVILYDPAFYATATGDGRIKVQYKNMSSSVATEGTIGIENESETDGLQYLFDGAYDVHAHPITNGMCILYTTTTTVPGIVVTLTPVNPPIIIPAGGGSFNYVIAYINNGTTPATFDAWIEAVLPDSSVYGPIILRNNLTLAPGGSISRNMTQNVPGAAPAGNYLYRANGGVYPSTIWTSDDFPFTKLGMDASSPGSWTITGWDEEMLVSTVEIPENYYLAQNMPNPFNPVTTIVFGIPKSTMVELSVYNTLGAKVAELVNGSTPAGNYSVTFDASQLSSGVYFYTLKTGEFSAVKKMLLLK